MAEVKIYTSIVFTKYCNVTTLTTDELAKMCKGTDCPMTIGACPFGESVDCQTITARDWLNLIGAKQVIDDAT